MSESEAPGSDAEPQIDGGSAANADDINADLINADDTVIDAVSVQADSDGLDSAEIEVEAEPLSETDQLLLDLTGERDQYKDIALRLQADFENYRKRVAKDQTDAVQRATERLAEALLPVLDACEAAYVQHPSEIEPIFNLMLGELRKQGLEALDLQDQAFDPSVADAVMHEPSDDADGPTVAQVLRSGYTWKGKVLRPAMVKVRG